MDGGTADLGHAKNGREVADAAKVLQITGERPVPWVGVLITVSQVLVHFQLEASLLHGLESDLDLLHVGDTVTLFDTKADLAVVLVAIVVVVRHQPFVDAEDATGLEDTKDLAIDTLQ